MSESEGCGGSEAGEGGGRERQRMRECVVVWLCVREGGMEADREK